MAAKAGYAEIAAHYRRLITDGTLQPGDTLPSLTKIRDEFQVTITTANRAMQLLKQEGLTTSRPGRETTVAERPDIAASGIARLRRLRRTGREYSPGETSTDHITMTRSVDDPRWADDLGLDLRDEVLIRRRVFRRKDGTPKTVAFSIIHPRAWAVVPELLQQGQLKPFWQDTYRERTGKEVHPSPEKRTARLAYPDELACLEVEVPDGAAVPVMVLYTTFHTEDGPIEVWEDVYAPGVWHEDESPSESE